MLQRSNAELAQARDLVDRNLEAQRVGERKFRVVGEARYELAAPGLGVEFDADRLRRERYQLCGELTVRCSIPGVRTFGGVLSVSDLNFSSASALTNHSRMLAGRARVEGINWQSLLDEFAMRILDAEAKGSPAIDLRDVAEPGNAFDHVHEVGGVVLPRRHPGMIFGDGGNGKSLLMLWISGHLSRRGERVLLADWEMGASDHRERLGRLFPDSMPEIRYARCERPLMFEVDRLRRMVQDDGVTFMVLDSVGVGCSGSPETAESALAYMRAVRRLGVGCLLVAHQTKTGMDDKTPTPFGSVFWRNSVRKCWHVRRSDDSSGDTRLVIGLTDVKANLGARSAPVAMEFQFEADGGPITVQRADVFASPDLAQRLSVRQRMLAALRHGAMGCEALAGETGADVETVRRTARRYKDSFKILDSGRIGLITRVS